MVYLFLVSLHVTWLCHFSYGMGNTFFEPELDLEAEDTDSDSSRYVD